MGKSKERLYAIYRGMIARCYNINTPNYHRYGGRGIKVCKEWLDDYEVFKEWAYETGYNPLAPRGITTLDRTDNDGDYTPQNCRWVDMKVQNNNQHPAYTFTDKKESCLKRKRKIVWTIDGVTKSGLEWCKEYGVNIMFVKYRIEKLGMTPYEALTTPKKNQGRGRLWYVSGISEKRSHKRRKKHPVADQNKQDA